MIILKRKLAIVTDTCYCLDRHKLVIVIDTCDSVDRHKHLTYVIEYDTRFIVLTCRLDI